MTAGNRAFAAAASQHPWNVPSSAESLHSASRTIVPIAPLDASGMADLFLAALMPSQAVHLARFFTFACWLMLAGTAGGQAPKQIDWLTDYRAARSAAEAERKLLLVWFQDLARPVEDDRFADVGDAPAIVEQISGQCIAARLPIDSELEMNGKPKRLLEQGAFAELHGQPGLAIIDLTDSVSQHFGHVVSIYPQRRNRFITAEHLSVLLDLPAGSLTQRTLIFAIRTHPERPASTAAELLPLLADEASRHAQHQARIRRQGHHGWSERFHSINARLPAGLVAYEVCAE